MNVSPKVVGPGVWTSDAVGAREAAQAAKAPCVVVVCKTDGTSAECTNCLRLEKAMFDTDSLAELMQLNGVYLVYLQARTPAGISYMTGVAGMLPYVSVYGVDGKLVGKRITYVKGMDTPVGFNNLVQGRLAGLQGAEPNPTPEPAPTPAPKPAKVSWWKRWFGATVLLLTGATLAGCEGTLPSNVLSSRNTPVMCSFSNSTNCSVNVNPAISGGATTTPSITVPYQAIKEALETAAMPGASGAAPVLSTATKDALLSKLGGLAKPTTPATTATP